MNEGERWRLVFGFCMLVVIGSLAAMVALGKVMEESSYGLQIILGCLTTLAGGFATWAFGKSQEPK